MKFTVLARRQAEEATTAKKVSRVERIIQYIDINPGAKSSEVANFIYGPNFKNAANKSERHTRISAALYSMISIDKPKIKRTLLDGSYHYYPYNYLLTKEHGVKAPANVKRIIKKSKAIKDTNAIKTSVFADTVEKAAKDFVWDLSKAGGGETTLQNFIEWLRQQ